MLSSQKLNEPKSKMKLTLTMNVMVSSFESQPPLILKHNLEHFSVGNPLKHFSKFRELFTKSVGGA